MEGHPKSGENTFCLCPIVEQYDLSSPSYELMVKSAGKAGGSSRLQASGCFRAPGATHKLELACHNFQRVVVQAGAPNLNTRNPRRRRIGTDGIGEFPVARIRGRFWLFK